MSTAARRNASFAFSLAALAAGMLMLAFASAPLYRLFCESTGFGGTTRRAESAPVLPAATREITIRFNADVDPGLPWEFRPGERDIKVKIGENMLTHYVVKNLAGRPVTGHATYNALPDKVGAYFSKVECFCFKDQTLGAKQEATLPVSFFIDPAMLEDPAMDDVKTITLSYTFFPSKSEAKAP